MTSLGSTGASQVTIDGCKAELGKEAPVQKQSGACAAPSASCPPAHSTHEATPILHPGSFSKKKKTAGAGHMRPQRVLSQVLGVALAPG